MSKSEELQLRLSGLVESGKFNHDEVVQLEWMGKFAHWNPMGLKGDKKHHPLDLLHNS